MKQDELEVAVASGVIDTVMVCMVDMQGRLMGKRCHADFFIRHGYEKNHACNYLLADDMDMVPVPGYASASWTGGYGDFVLKPDLSTLRLLPWLNATALVICDVYDDNGMPVGHSPRQILKKQLQRLSDRGMRASFASELEFYLFDDSYDAIWKKIPWNGDTGELQSGLPYPVDDASGACDAPDQKRTLRCGDRN
ncbi:hypothetical protein ACFOHQ_00345 [Xanthomonas fragariae]